MVALQGEDGEGQLSFSGREREDAQAHPGHGDDIATRALVRAYRGGGARLGAIHDDAR